MNTTPPTAAESEAVLVRELLAEQWSPRAIAGFIIAERRHGILRENCPPWKRASYLAQMRLGNRCLLTELEAVAAVIDSLQVQMIAAGSHPAQISHADVGDGVGF